MKRSQDADKVIVRLPEGLRDHIKAEAASNHRSMNAEIVHRLLTSYGIAPQGPKPFEEWSPEEVAAARMLVVEAKEIAGRKAAEAIATKLGLPEVPEDLLVGV